MFQRSGESEQNERLRVMVIDCRPEAGLTGWLKWASCLIRTACRVRIVEIVESATHMTTTWATLLTITKTWNRRAIGVMLGAQ